MSSSGRGSTGSVATRRRWAAKHREPTLGHTKGPVSFTAQFQSSSSGRPACIARFAGRQSDQRYPISCTLERVLKIYSMFAGVASSRENGLATCNNHVLLPVLHHQRYHAQPTAHAPPRTRSSPFQIQRRAARIRYYSTPRVPQAP
jgi:hypothetical protein